MNPAVVDASVVAAALLAEEHTQAARDLLLSGRALCAPDLIYAEVGNVLWKRQVRRELTPDEAEDLLADVLRLPLDILPSARLVAPALGLAVRTRQTVYDCLYLAAAIDRGAVLVTADQALVKALAGTPLAKHVAFIGDKRDHAR